MNPEWLLAIAAAGLQLILAALLAANYRRIVYTPVGKYMLILAALFLLQGLLAAAFYTKWAHTGYGLELAIPMTAITLMSLAGLAILYKISRM